LSNGPENHKLKNGNTIAPQGRISCAIITKFVLFIRHFMMLLRP